jgi:molybdopterin synthase catalytic subunit
MDAPSLMKKIMTNPRLGEAGMILTHTGIVRAYDRQGKKVHGLRVHVDRQKLEALLEEKRKDPGIIEILVNITAEKDLAVGDVVMQLLVAGDIREHVLTTLSETLEAIKTEVTSKTQYYEEKSMSKFSKPKHYQNIQKNYPEFIKAVEDLGRTSMQAGPLDEKTVLLLRLAAAAAMRSKGSVQSHARQALESGVTSRELEHALVALTSTIGFPTVAAALSWIGLDEKE